MFKVKQRTPVATFAVAVAFTLLVGPASADAGTSTADVGTPAEGWAYDQKVVIGPNRNSVHVSGGEIGKFVIRQPGSADKTFTWRFDIYGGMVVDLSKFAPAGVLDRPIKVFVEVNPLYLGGD